MLGSGSDVHITSVVIHNLDPKRLPVEVEADDDDKDMAVKGRRKFKPAKGSEDGTPYQRLQIRAKRDEASVCLLGSFSGSGDSYISERMSIDATTGLVDGTSLGFMEVRHGTGDAEDIHRVEAVWDAGLDGFTVGARENGAPIGASVHYAGARELRFFVEQAGAQLDLLVAIPGTGPYDHGDQTLVSTSDLGTTGLPCRGAFGAEGLSRKASMYFVDLLCDGSVDALDLTQAELSLSALLQWAGTASGNCETFADPADFFPNLVLAQQWAGVASLAYAAAQSQLDDALADGDIVGTKAKLLGATVGKGRKRAEKALKLAEKLVGGSEWGVPPPPAQLHRPKRLSSFATKGASTTRPAQSRSATRRCSRLGNTDDGRGIQRGTRANHCAYSSP